MISNDLFKCLIIFSLFSQFFFSSLSLSSGFNARPFRPKRAVEVVRLLSWPLDRSGDACVCISWLGTASNTVEVSRSNDGD